jgi:glycosyltransferase involved in cell wall biosynthesis
VKLLVVSHSCVTAINQQFYAKVAQQTGWQIDLVVPSNWRDEYGRDCKLERWPAFTGELLGIPVFRPGNIILHAYRFNMAKLLRRMNPDIVYVNHEPYAVATAQVYAANSLAGRRAIGFYSCQNIFKCYPVPFRWTEAAVLKQSSFAFPISDSVNEVCRRKGYEGPSTILPLAVDEETYFPRPDSESIRKSYVRPDQALLGYVGRLVEAKGLRTLIEALGVLKDLDWKFVFIGTGPLAQQMEERCKALGISERVHFLGFVEHIQTPAYLSAFDWLVLPSESQSNWREQFGRVVLEAMACGTPVIGSNSGEIPKLIKATGGGLIFTERRVDELADTLRMAIADRAAAQLLATTGREATIKQFGMESVAQSFITALDGVSPLPRSAKHRLQAT